MRIIFRDLGRRKLQATHGMDYKSTERYHMVVPACIPATILESIEIDPIPPTPTQLFHVLYELPTSLIFGSLFFGLQRIISWTSNLNKELTLSLA